MIDPETDLVGRIVAKPKAANVLAATAASSGIERHELGAVWFVACLVRYPHQGFALLEREAKRTEPTDKNHKPVFPPRASAGTSPRSAVRAMCAIADRALQAAY